VIEFFNSLEYLKNGSINQQSVYNTLTVNSVFDYISSFTPFLAGTFPLGIDVQSSDVDIICYWKNKEDFKSSISQHFSQFPDFKITEKWINGHLTVIANFCLDYFQIEIFGQNRPVKEQEAYQHMIIEYLLLEKNGEEFKKQIIELKRKGIKTEPAFAQLLQLEGDPYKALLEIKLP
jgi:hypothetical protein